MYIGCYREYRTKYEPVIDVSDTDTNKHLGCGRMGKHKAFTHRSIMMCIYNPGQYNFTNLTLKGDPSDKQELEKDSCTVYSHGRSETFWIKFAIGAPKPVLL
ncbi:hypothetical protein LOAG_06071 [Loa loa]|uniref:Uncharacterized protein n=1 Tax=Loa loa TaxID=7209 RepID=A0A1S0TZF8_LOALO|nr:hypothetical protein LOAG_06071 [Loa loa]EFO22416.1 hypothetical protein LOAG_06071 [Loa loa]